MAENLNTINPKTKNSTLPFSRGTLANLQKGLADGKISAPALHFLTEDNKKCFAFVDIDGTIYQINLDRIEKVEEALSGMTDPETGEQIPVTTYVQEKVAPVEEQVETVATQVETVTTEVTEIKEQVGYVQMLISGGE